jgi:hypothetical protein
MITISIYALIYLFFAHFLADYGLQFSFIAKNKASNFWALLLHVLLYIGLMALALYPLSHSLGWFYYFCGFNFILHLLVDFHTSKLIELFMNINRGRACWLMLGFDQFLHAACLFSSIGMLAK